VWARQEDDREEESCAYNRHAEGEGEHGEKRRFEPNGKGRGRHGDNAV
jgi:hypothetical protein